MTRLLLTSLLLLITNAPFSAVLVASHIITPSHSFWTHQTTPTPSECANPPRDNCAFYADCLESRYHCGPDGYPIGYGQKFCENFSDGRAELSARGQTWMLDVMQCLQDTLVPEATGGEAGATCTSIKKKAFRLHAPCYVDNGLCWLPPRDWLAIVHIVGIETLIGSKEALLSSLETAVGCIKEYLEHLAQGPDGQAV